MEVGLPIAIGIRRDTRDRESALQIEDERMTAAILKTRQMRDRIGVEVDAGERVNPVSSSLPKQASSLLLSSSRYRARHQHSHS
jgi:hypothetical protein